MADALSRIQSNGEEYSVITVLKPAWVTEVINSYQGDEEVHNTLIELATLPYNVSYFCYSDGLMRFKGKLVVEKNGNL